MVSLNNTIKFDYFGISHCKYTYMFPRISDYWFTRLQVYCLVKSVEMYVSCEICFGVNEFDGISLKIYIIEHVEFH